MSSNAFCFRACLDGRSATKYCGHVMHIPSHLWKPSFAHVLPLQIYDTLGCGWCEAKLTLFHNYSNMVFDGFQEYARKLRVRPPFFEYLPISYPTLRLLIERVSAPAWVIRPSQWANTCLPSRTPSSREQKRSPRRFFRLPHSIRVIP